MERELLLILARLVKSYQKQAEEQGIAIAKWRTRLGAIEGELLRLADADITAELDKAKPKTEADDDQW